MSARSRAHPWFARELGDMGPSKFEDSLAAAAVRHFMTLWREEVARTPWLEEALAGYEVTITENPWSQRAMGREDLAGDLAHAARWHT